MKVLITGVAGFIGFHLANRLFDDGNKIIGLDNLNDYYDVTLKQDRLQQLEKNSGFDFFNVDLVDQDSTKIIFDKYKPQIVVHLAAQAGVRYSLENPNAYTRSNLIGFANVLEACRSTNIEHLYYASSSSVYGGNTKTPFSINDQVDSPLNYYGATKRANELMAMSYGKVFGLNSTGFRFFTVYGPWGRPDMSYFVFTDNITRNKPVNVYNNGDHSRDFTFIDDIIDGITNAIDVISKKGNNNAHHRIYNLGNNRPVELLRYISIIEKILGKKAKLNMLPKQPGEMDVTYADIKESAADFGFSPSTDIETGMEVFINWYRQYYKIG